MQGFTEIEKILKARNLDYSICGFSQRAEWPFRYQASIYNHSIRFSTVGDNLVEALNEAYSRLVAAERRAAAKL